MTPSAEQRLGDVVARARDDVDLFARVLVGQPLWPHQLEIARSPARIRCACIGRQAGKTRTLSVLALHEAFRAPRRKVLIVSAGDDAAKDVLAEISALAESPLLSGSVVDDDARLVTLSNGSSIRSIPASEKQARGKSIDLLILDEAAYISDELWRAVRYTTIARRGSRVVMTSTPYGRRDRFFAQHYNLGRAAGGVVDVDGVSIESFHWPSTVSPLVDEALVNFWRRTDPDRVFRMEVLAEWCDDEGAYFSAAELDAATGDYELVEPAAAGGMRVSGGVDWGQRDANALVLVGRLDRTDRLAREGGHEPGPLFVPYLVERYGVTYASFIDHIVDVGAGFGFESVYSETNGVGAMPTEVLRKQLTTSRPGATVHGVHTDNRSKEDGFGAMKLLMQNNELVLPRHPRLLAQLAALEFETLDSGSLSIAVPERHGHDDLAMALMLALGQQVAEAAAWRPAGQVGRYRSGRHSGGHVVWRDVDDEDGDPQLRRLRQAERLGYPGAAEVLQEYLVGGVGVFAGTNRAR